MIVKFEAHEVPAMRNEYGYWDHPAFPWDTWPDDTNLAPYFKDLGFRCKGTLMQDELDVEVVDKFFDDGETDCTFWEPKKPDGQGWFLASIHDTEEGPCALWVSPILVTVSSIVVDYLTEKGFDGLFNSDIGCACAFEDLFENCAGESCSECQPGYEKPCACGEHDFHISAEKAV